MTLTVGEPQEAASIAGEGNLLYLRNLIFYVAALAYCGPFLVLAPLVYLPLPTRIVWPFVTAWLKGILFLLKWLAGVDYVMRGADRIQETPVLFAASHQSTWENLFFQVLLGNPVMIAKEEIFNYPLVGNIVRRNRHIRAYRGGDLDMVRQSLEEARAQADQGRSVLIYPSGTRTGTRQPAPIRRGVAALYGILGRPCVPVAHNSGAYWLHGSWLRRPGTIIVEFGEPIPPGLPKRVFLDTLSERLRSATTRLLSAARDRKGTSEKSEATMAG